jgi:hypothetical protein
MSQTTPAPARDDFPQTVKDLLAHRAGFICAFPGCGRLTVGPSEDRKSGLSMVGVAAHITAASPNGPRYDAAMSPAERSSELNGIWMCQTHGKLVDDNASRHTVAELHRWKSQHEEWVFSRVANADNHVHNGVAKVVLQRVGVFVDREEVKLGRHNIIYGANASGKSTFCQALAALSGSSRYLRFARRFSFGHGDPNTVIEVGCAYADSLTTVRLTRQQALLPGRRTVGDQRLHIEVNGNVAAYWPRSLFNVTILDDQMHPHRDRPKNLLRRTMQAIAVELDIPEPVLWDALRDEMFLTSPLGFRFRRTGIHSVDVRIPGGRQFYVPFNGLSGGESVLAAIDVTIKLLMTDVRRNPWMFILDTGFFSRLDERAKQFVVGALQRIDDPFVQTIVCVNFEDEVNALKGRMSDKWIGATQFGELTIHSFV